MMFTGKELLVLCSLLLVLEYNGVYSASAGKQVGGCLANGTTISSMFPQDLNTDLSSRIYHILLGDNRSQKNFMNREGCLPPKLTYLEFRLYPDVADTNRIVWQKMFQVFYFTSDHYKTFNRIRVI